MKAAHPTHVTQAVRPYIHSHLVNFYVKCCGCPTMLTQHSPLATVSICFSSQQALLSVNYYQAPWWSQNVSHFSPKISSLYHLSPSSGGLLLGLLSPHICSSPLRLSLSPPTSVSATAASYGCNDTGINTCAIKHTRHVVV